MDFASYYHGSFHHDLQWIVAEGWNVHAAEPDLAGIQPRTLSAENPAVIELPEERRAHFGTALFFTVLIDQVMYTHFRSSYAPFRQLTQYPKFRGDCPGGCRAHLRPQLIFQVLARPCEVDGEDWLPYYQASLVQAIPVMRAELLSFACEHLPSLNDEKVWRFCAAEPPLAWPQLTRGSQA